MLPFFGLSINQSQVHKDTYMVTIVIPFINHDIKYIGFESLNDLIDTDEPIRSLH